MDNLYWESGLKKTFKGLFFNNINVSKKSIEGDANRQTLAKNLGQFADIVTPYQTHSANCLYIGLENPMPDNWQGDALITDTPDLPIGVITADCAPVLVAGTKRDGSPIIAAIHAGARGAARGVIAGAIAMMRTHGTQNLESVIGPCIHESSYEVGTDFQDEIIAYDHNAYAFFKALGGDKFTFDLPRYVAALLEKEGATSSQIDIDTYTSEKCFSHRRAVRTGQLDEGRQLSAIVILRQ